MACGPECGVVNAKITLRRAIRHHFRRDSAESAETSPSRRQRLSEDQGKTMLTVMPADSYYKTGKAEYERVKE